MDMRLLILLAQVRLVDADAALLCRIIAVQYFDYVTFHRSDNVVVELHTNDSVNDSPAAAVTAVA